MNKLLRFLFCKKIPQHGFYQECRGYYKRRDREAHIVVYSFQKREVMKGA